MRAGMERGEQRTWLDRGVKVSWWASWCRQHRTSGRRYGLDRHALVATQAQQMQKGRKVHQFVALVQPGARKSGRQPGGTGFSVAALSLARGAIGRFLCRWSLYMSAREYHTVRSASRFSGAWCSVVSIGQGAVGPQIRILGALSRMPWADL